MDLPTVAITAPDLPSPLPTLQQSLMDLFYAHWLALTKKVRENNAALCEGCCDVFVNPNVPGMLRPPVLSEVAAVFPEKVYAAVILGNLNYQVENGGIMQWNDNEHSARVEDLRALFRDARTLGVEHAGTMLAILDDFVQRKADDEAPRESILCTGDDGMPCEIDDNSFDDYRDLTARFHELPMLTLMQGMLDRLFPAEVELRKAA